VPPTGGPIIELEKWNEMTLRSRARRLLTVTVLGTAVLASGAASALLALALVAKVARP
jgi:hypothetical protein